MEEWIEKVSQRNGVLVQVDLELCAGFGDCVAVAPDVFALDDDNQAVILDPDAADRDVLKTAADVCPVSAILLFDGAGVQIAPDI
jgi:ferredoxin